jgi:hypothetical protein
MTLHLSVPSSTRESFPIGSRWYRILASSRGLLRVYGLRKCCSIIVLRIPEEKKKKTTNERIGKTGAGLKPEDVMLGSEIANIISTLSLCILQPSKLLREHIPLKVKALRRRERLADCLRKLGRVGGGQHDLYNGRRAYEVEFCK